MAYTMVEGKAYNPFLRGLNLLGELSVPTCRVECWLIVHITVSVEHYAIWHCNGRSFRESIQNL